MSFTWVVQPMSALVCVQWRGKGGETEKHADQARSISDCPLCIMRICSQNIQTCTAWRKLEAPNKHFCLKLYQYIRVNDRAVAKIQLYEPPFLFIIRSLQFNWYLKANAEHFSLAVQCLSADIFNNSSTVLLFLNFTLTWNPNLAII